MQITFYYLASIATIAVLAVLIMGLYTMMQNKGANLSQRLMRWRVGLQFVAIVLLMGFIYASS